MKTILIADDHVIVRLGAKLIIESFPQKYHLIEASTCAQVVKALSSQQVHYAILDMFMEDGNMFSNVEQIAALTPQTAILIYSMHPEKIYAKRLMQKGVRGFVSKRAPLEELEIAIRNVLNGEIYLSAGMKEMLFAQATIGLAENPVDLLSDRELEVVEYMATGIGAKEIANIMHLDITTVSTYRRRALEKLDVQTTTELKEKFLYYKMQE